VPVGDSHGLTRFGYGFLWTLGDNGVMSQIDPRSSKLVRSISVGFQAADFAAGAGGMWVTDRHSATVLRLDPVTGQIDLRAQLSSRGLRHPQPTGGIAIDDGSLWIARGSEAIDRRDPSTLHLQERIPMRAGECGTAGCRLGVGDGRVWVAGGENGTLVAIDEATNEVASTTALRPYLCCVTVGGGSVWAAEAHGVAQLSPRGHVLRRFEVGRAGVADVDYDDGYVYAAADSTSDLVRIDAHDGQVRITHLGNGLIGMAASNGMVALAAMPPATNPTAGLGRKVLRIGLTMDWLDPSDPAVAGPPNGKGRGQWQLHHATCSQLYQQPGATGSPVQPELATGMPVPSADGRTWTIRLATGARFSPPLNRPVSPEDVRASIVRALSPQLGLFAPAARVLRDVVGARAYRRGRVPDVTGISVHGSDLVIRTRRRVNDLAARLALPYFCVLPAGCPAPPGGYLEPMPTAGPYYLAAHFGGTIAVLRRNPGYHGSRPQHLDALVFHIVDERRGIDYVRRGRLDYFAGSHTAISGRVGCRATRPPVPGLNVAALCLARSDA